MRRFANGWMFVTVAWLSACNHGSRALADDNPFAFYDLERMVSQPPNIQNIGAAAFAYEERRRAFNAMYGEGVGPAKGTPEFLACRTTFDEVSAAASAQNGEIQKVRELEQALMACRMASRRWSTAREMATFGNDIRQMTAGALVMLGYRVEAQCAVTGRAILGNGLKLLEHDRSSA